MSRFRFIVAGLALAVTPLSAQMSKPLGSQWIDAVRDRDAVKLNTIASDRSKLNAAVLDYQRDGEGAIHIAVRAGNIEYLRFMLALGANPNLTANKNGETPLTLAVDGSTDVVSLLQSRGARVELANRAGDTPLIKAVAAHRPDMVQLLLSLGADPDRTDYVGRSARYYATADARYPQIAKALADAPKKAARAVAGPKLN